MTSGVVSETIFAQPLFRIFTKQKKCSTINKDGAYAAHQFQEFTTTEGI